MYLLGGKDGTFSHKDMWMYNTGLETWESVKGTGDKPLNLQGHTMTSSGSKLYVFGGKFNFGSDNESPFWIFDTGMVTVYLRYVFCNPSVLTQCVL